MTWGAPALGASSAPSPGIAYTNPVNEFAPNGYGLYDMAGNIWQWCWDFYGGRYYRGLPDPVADPTGPGSSSAVVPMRVLRGVSWDSTAFYPRVSNRAMDVPVHKLHGFRVARKAPRTVGRGWSPFAQGECMSGL